MTKRVVTVVVVLFALTATALWLSCQRSSPPPPSRSRAKTQDADGNGATERAAPPSPAGSALTSSFPMPPVAPDPGVPEPDRKDDELWRKTPEAKAAWDEIMGTSVAVERGGKPLTTNQATVLIAYMQSPHYFARWKAVIAAGTARSDATKSMLEPHIINLLTDRVYIVRMYAADSLEMIGDTSAIPHLEPLLDDRWEVADVVKKAIFKLSHPEENAPKNH